MTATADGSDMDQRRNIRWLVALVGSQIVLVTAITGVLGRDASDFASRTVRVETVAGSDERDPVVLEADRPRRDLIAYVPTRPASTTPTTRPPASSSVPTTAPPTTLPVSTVAPTISPSPPPSSPEPDATIAAVDSTTTTGRPGLDDDLPSARDQKPVAGAQVAGDEAGPTTGPDATTTTSTTVGDDMGSDDTTSGEAVGDPSSISTRAATTTSTSAGTVSSSGATASPATAPATTTSATTISATTTSATTTTVTGTSRVVATASTSTPTSASTSTSTEAPPTTPATTAPTTVRPTTGGGPNAGLEAIRNIDSRFGRYAEIASDDLDLMALTEPALVRDNGTVGDGQFRAACQYSHFAYDDPIVYPGQPGRSHLHMFFGNTAADANTTTRSLVDSGGSTCNGFELNRSGYWTPALLDGRGNAVVPEMIVLYYKTKQPERVQRMPQGLKMIAGNTTAESFTADWFLFWSCGDSGGAYNVGNRIPECGGDTFNATIVFPQCWDGRNLDSADHRSHMALVSPHADCPASHPVRLPQISILLYFAGQDSVGGWHLSSDRSGGFNTGPGATLHADWWGGWNDDAMDLWIDGCMKAARNCSFGQTGTDRVLAKLNAFQNYAGPDVLPLP